MKEHIRNLKNRAGREATGVLLATSILGVAAPPNTAHLSIYSCEHFLTSYSPAMDTNLQTAIDALRYKQSIAFSVYPNPAYARKDLAQVIPVISHESVVGQLTVAQLEVAYNKLSSQQDLQVMQQAGVSNTTFAVERREIADAESQLYTTVTACEQLVPTSLRRDSWYTEEQVAEIIHSLWDKYKLEIFLVLGFLGVGILENLFIGDEN